MTEPNAAGGDGGAGKPAGEGAPKPQGVDVESLVSAVVERLTPLVAQQVTGAVKRNVASTLEGLDLDALKGLTAGTPKPGADDKGKVTPEQVKVADLTRQVEALTKQSATLRARAVRGAVSAEIAKHSPTEGATELLVDRFASLVKEDESSGSLFVDAEDGPRPFGEHLSGFFKSRPDLVRASARTGSGAGASAGAWQGDMPKSKSELLFTVRKDAGGRDQRVETPERRTDFIKRFGKDAYDRLP